MEISCRYIEKLIRSNRGVVLAFLFVFSAINPVLADWVLPTGFQDAEGQWSNEIQAYDGDTATYASDSSTRTGWGAYLIFDLSSTITCSRVRLNADFEAQVDKVDIDIYRDGAWVDVFEGPIANCDWEEITFTSGNVSQARFRYNYVDGSYIYWLYEFGFFEDTGSIDPPSCETLNASSVEQTTGILHANCLDDGGEPCEYRFQYGFTDSYGTDTPWRGSQVTGDTFSQQVTGLVNAETYHFRVQMRNSSGMTSGEDLTFTTGARASGFVCPTGYSDPDGGWQNEDAAFDDNLGTYAKSYHAMNADQWSPYLYFTHNQIVSDRLRFYARGNSGAQYYVDSVDVDVYRDGAWVDVYQGAFNDKEWVEYTFTEGDVSEARIRFHVNAANCTLFFELYDFQFYNISDNPATLSWTGETKYENDGLNPETGDSQTPFEFRVEYTDLDNDGPIWKKVYVDKNGNGSYADAGEQLELVLASDAAPEKRDGIFTNGEIYTVTTTIPYGPNANNITYYFGANDGTGDATGLPTTPITAPTVVSYLEFNVVPASVSERNYFSVSVKATDGFGTVDVTKNYEVTLAKNSGPGEVLTDSALTQNLVNGEYTWNDLYIMESGTYSLILAGDGNTVTSGDITIAPSVTAAVLDDYSGASGLTYSFDPSETCSWTRDFTYNSDKVFEVNTSANGQRAPEHSYASYDLTNSIPGWELGTAVTNTWVGWMRLNRNVSGWGNRHYSIGMVLAANNQSFNSNGVAGYALGYKNGPDKLVLFEFNNGIHGNDRTLPNGATEIIDTGYTHSTSSGINFYVERTPTGDWTVYYEAGEPFTATQAVEKASYSNVSTTVNNTSYAGTAYQYAGWVFAHNNDDNTWAAFDNFGAAMYSDIDAPVATAATNVGISSFTANWGSVAGATGYRLDVSKRNDFATFVYKNLSVAGTGSVVNVPDQGTYYYRVRSANGTVVSENSNTISVLVTEYLSVELKEADGTTDYVNWTISGMQNEGQVAIMDASNCVMVMNAGTSAQDFSISASASSWSLGTTAAEDQCVLMGLFNADTVPGEADFNTANDIITTTETWSSASSGSGKFEGLAAGTNIAAGTGSKFYIYLKAPSSVSSPEAQVITVTIGCKAH